MEAETSVQFIEEQQSIVVEVGRGGRSPVVGRLHKALLTLGVVISAYQVRALPSRTIERLVLARRDGGELSGEIAALTRAAVLPIALDPEV